MINYKVSIVVPVFNVEKYMNKCVNSLLNQTYKNIEIILVDDGSTDASPDICDKFANEYKNIVCIHKINGGLSDARNCGTSYATGDYVSYVDSDDYVDSNYIYSMIKAMEDEEADIVISCHFDEDENGVQLTKAIKSNRVTFLSPEEALEEMCYERRFGTTACAKLYKKGIIENFPFPRGKKYEDLFTIYKVIGNAKKIVLIQNAMYHYVQRQGSIRKSKWSDSVYDVMEASENLMAYVNKNYPLAKKAAIQRYFFSANEVYVQSFKEDNYNGLTSGIRKEMKKLYIYIIINKKISKLQKMRYFLMTYFPNIYRIIWIKCAK